MGEGGYKSYNTGTGRTTNYVCMKKMSVQILNGVDIGDDLTDSMLSKGRSKKRGPPFLAALVLLTIRQVILPPVLL